MDRSRFFHKVVQKAGEAESIQFLGAASQKEAIEQLQQQEIDLILTARELEDGPVDSLLRKLLDSPHGHIPVIMLTSSDTLDIREQYFNLGVIDFVSKEGFSGDKLREQLDYFKQQDDMVIDMRKMPIAILDDSRLSLNVISSILKMYGINNLSLFSDPHELMESKDEYEIYFIDLILPKISGERIVRELRKAHPHKIIIAISSLDKYNTIVHVLESGADDYIIKPFNSRLLMARLKSNFRSYQAMEEVKKQRDILSSMAVTDSLTGCSNHRFLIQRLIEEIEKVSRYKNSLSLLLLDIDNFKSVNDEFGHPVGDIVLKKLADLFMKNSRKSDVFGRYGGEEFLLILPETDINQAFIICERLRILFANLEIGEVGRSVTFSGGLAEWNGETDEAFLKCADELLYQAKNAGRNQIKTGNPK